MSLGAITVPGYTTSNEDELLYLLNHSESKIVFLSSEILPKFDKIKKKLLYLKHVICFDEFNTPVPAFNLPEYTLIKVSDPTNGSFATLNAKALKGSESSNFLTIFGTWTCYGYECMECGLGFIISRSSITAAGSATRTVRTARTGPASSHNPDQP